MICTQPRGERRSFVTSGIEAVTIPPPGPRATAFAEPFVLTAGPARPAQRAEATAPRAEAVLGPVTALAARYRGRHGAWAAWAAWAASESSPRRPSRRTGCWGPPRRRRPPDGPGRRWRSAAASGQP